MYEEQSGTALSEKRLCAGGFGWGAQGAYESSVVRLGSHCSVMAYQTYTTEAIVCRALDKNTADRTYQLFTREAGMLFAEARSSREERSRQRYALQEFSLLRASLVRGRYSWKVGSVEPLSNFYHDAVNQEARGSVVKLVRFLRRFVQGELPDVAFYDTVRVGLEELSATCAERTSRELQLQVALLVQLGYVRPNAANATDPAQLQILIDRAIRDSQL